MDGMGGVWNMKLMGRWNMDRMDGWMEGAVDGKWMEGGRRWKETNNSEFCLVTLTLRILVHGRWVGGRCLEGGDMDGWNRDEHDVLSCCHFPRSFFFPPTGYHAVSDAQCPVYSGLCTGRDSPSIQQVLASPACPGLSLHSKPFLDFLTLSRSCPSALWRVALPCRVALPGRRALPVLPGSG